MPNGVLLVLLIDAENTSLLSNSGSSLTSKVMSKLVAVGPNCRIPVFPPGITGDTIVKSNIVGLVTDEVANGSTAGKG